MFSAVQDVGRKHVDPPSLLESSITLMRTVSLLNTLKPVTNDHPLGPEKAVFSGRWSLVRDLRCTTIKYECETVRAWRSGL